MDLQPLMLTDVTQWGHLLALCFNQSPDNMIQLIHWLYCLGGLEAYGLWDNTELVAQYACLHRTIHYKNQPILAGMSMNMAVHPDYRGQGLVKQVSQPVYSALEQKGFHLGMGFSNAQGVKVDKHSKSYGYQVVGQMQPHIIIAKSFNRPALIICDQLPPLTAIVPEQATDRVHFPKDIAYIRQRYQHHPTRQYQFAIWQDRDHIHGVIVYKQVKLWGIPAVALLDVYGEDIHELLLRWSTTLRQNNIFLAHMLVSPYSSIKKHLQKNWHIINTPFTRNPYFLTIKPLSDTIGDMLLDFARWDLIGGDVL